jgi:hypothetical protein
LWFKGTEEPQFVKSEIVVQAAIACKNPEVGDGAIDWKEALEAPEPNVGTALRFMIYIKNKAALGKRHSTFKLS